MDSPVESLLIHVDPTNRFPSIGGSWHQVQSLHGWSRDDRPLLYSGFCDILRLLGALRFSTIHNLTKFNNVCPQFNGSL